MATFIMNLMRRLGLIQQRAPSRGGSILGAVLGAAVGSLLLKKLLFSRRVSKGRVPAKKLRITRDDSPSLVPSQEGVMTPPHGDVLARSVTEASTLKQRH